MTKCGVTVNAKFGRLLLEMASSRYVFPTCLLLALLFIGFQFASAMRCYQCNSIMQPTCNDPFDNRTDEMKPCNDSVVMCRKIIQEAYYEGAWDVRYIRQCAVGPRTLVGAEAGKWCQQRVGTYRVKMRICYCDNKDGCNVASIQRSYILTPVLAAFTAYFCAHTRLFG